MMQMIYDSGLGMGFTTTIDCPNKCAIKHKHFQWQHKNVKKCQNAKVQKNKNQKEQHLKWECTLKT